MWRLSAFFLLLVINTWVWAQELSLFAGGLKESGSNDKAPAWSLEYRHPFGEHFAASIAWLNEGHVPSHHRDGQALHLWARTNVLDRRLSLAAGLGPYRYFDTAKAKSASGFANDHGWGAVGSLSATYYADNRWLYQLRFNRIIAHNSFNTSSLTLGIGYQLEPMIQPGPETRAPSQLEKTTNNEVTAFLGRTIVNSFDSESSSARAIEYRRGFARHLDLTVGLLNEGDARLIRRNGVTAQLWAVRQVLASDRLILGVGFGPYYAVNRRRAPQPGEASGSNFAWIFTASAAYRLAPHWDVRLSWNRIDTNYNRDTDVVLLGAGYRF